MNQFRRGDGARRRVLLALQFVLLSSLAGLAQTAPAPNTAAPIATPQPFVESLLHRMTLQEKIGQLSQSSRKDIAQNIIDARIRKGEVGSILFATDPAEVNRLQHLAVAESRLHIPLLFGYDIVHGFRTINPIPLAMAASWDPALVGAHPNPWPPRSPRRRPALGLRPHGRHRPRRTLGTHHGRRRRRSHPRLRHGRRSGPRPARPLRRQPRTRPRLRQTLRRIRRCRRRSATTKSQTSPR